MSKRLGTISIEITPHHWKATGDEDDPRARLLAHIKINGVDFHAEAVEVFEGERRADIDQNALAQEFNAQTPEWIRLALRESADWESAQLMTIEGRQYAVILTPFQQ